MLWRFQSKGEDDFEFDALHERWVNCCYQQKVIHSFRFIGEFFPPRKGNPALSIFSLNTEFRMFSFPVCIINNKNVIVSIDIMQFCSHPELEGDSNSILCIKVDWSFVIHKNLIAYFVHFFFFSINIGCKNYQRMVYD